MHTISVGGSNYDYDSLEEISSLNDDLKSWIEDKINIKVISVKAYGCKCKDEEEDTFMDVDWDIELEKEPTEEQINFLWDEWNEQEKFCTIESRLSE